MSVIVIGDVHGCIKTLTALLDKLPVGPEIVFVGDLIDRGSSSMEVVELVRNNYKSVMGNHEDMMIRSYLPWNYHTYRNWQGNGGDACLDSYQMGGKYDRAETNPLFKVHFEWMENLPLFLEFPQIIDEKKRKLVVSHSSAHSVWKKGPEFHQFKETLLWNRLPNVRAIKDVYNVFGHTPQKNGPRIRKCYANIDTGCPFNEPGYGQLTALQFPEMIVYSQKNIDEVL